MDIDTPFAVDFVHRLRFTRDALDPANPALAGVFASDEGARAAVFADEGLLRASPDLPARVARYWAAHPSLPPLAPEVHTVPGGETVKNDRAHLERLLDLMHGDRLCRHSTVVAIGGGAMLDAVGFAAAVAHRGVRLVRLPTTTLAQCDSGVGVKNGVNAYGKKNYLGVFAPPWAVVNDTDFLTTLAERDWRSGFSEAVKVGLVKDAALFEAIESGAAGIRARDPDAATPILQRSAELHLRHITESGDPFETTVARPLDFGHWAAHRLEHLTGYRLKHGEAVAIGIAIDVAYAELSGWLPGADADRVYACLQGLGFSLTDGSLADLGPLLEGLEEFREHLGGRTAVAMLDGIGSSFDVHEIDTGRVGEAIRRVQHAGGKG